MPRLYLSAAHKSSGKTTLTLGLARALAERGRAVRCFKRGPDYIDPLWLARASGRPAYNLDFNTQSPETIRALLAHGAAGMDISLIEGNKGLFDGVSTDGSDSNAALARLIGAPVVLVIDCGGITRGIAPLLHGYTTFEPGLPFAGVILNKVAGARHEAKLRAAVETYTDLSILGAVPRREDLVIVERHLGLMPANEDRTAEDHIAAIAAMVADSVDLDALESAAAEAPPPPPAPTPHAAAPALGQRPLRIGIARDAAFAFYYQDDLEAFADNGADLVTVDTLRDRALPPGLDGLVLGGGFPETQAPALEANVSLRKDIRRALIDGLPCYAECGGLMYLSRAIRWHGKSHGMVGLIPADTVMHPKPFGRGYVRLALDGGDAVPWTVESGADGIIAAHEFHYSTLDGLEEEEAGFAYRVLRGQGITGDRDGLILGHTVASYAHMRGNWVRPFLDFIRSQGGANVHHPNGPLGDGAPLPLS